MAENKPNLPYDPKLSYWAQIPVSANEILPHLFAGNYPSGENEEFLRGNNITHVLNMTPEIHQQQVEGVEYLDLSLDDVSSGNISLFFKDAHAFIERARKSGGRAVVHCHMGISRACTISMAHLMQLNGSGELKRRSLKEAFAFVRRKREIAYPNNGFFRQLQKLEMSLTSGKMTSMSLEDYRMASFS